MPFHFAIFTHVIHTITVKPANYPYLALHGDCVLLYEGAMFISTAHVLIYVVLVRKHGYA